MFAYLTTSLKAHLLGHLRGYSPEGILIQSLHKEGTTNPTIHWTNTSNTHPTPYKN